ncbi:hypothetical protein ACT3SP_05625 [Brachybacterium sp. AOP43-C2-M15]|uniref:hypothetical protein n=1 Tax=Brachybacterium sp. AOP43-C2-M15 TaxID=3457661 RepID=UPI0040349294
MSSSLSSPGAGPGPGHGVGRGDGTGLDQRPGPGPGPLIEPGRRLTPSPERDRPWRLLTVLLGAATVLLVVLILAGATTATWVAGRGYSEIPATADLGTPTALTLHSGVGAVRVLPSGDVESVTLALVDPGTTALPAEEAQARARVTVEDAGGTSAHGTTVEVRQPESFSMRPWTSPQQDVLLLIPAGHEMALEVRTDVGDILVDGDFTALDVRSGVGDLELGPVTAPEGVTARADVGAVDLEIGSPAPATVDVIASLGDVDLLLPTDAGGEVSIAAQIGDIAVAAPGTGRWRVEATADLGEVRVDPGLTRGTGAEAGTLTAVADVGDVDITR